MSLIDSDLKNQLYNATSTVDITQDDAAQNAHNAMAQEVGDYISLNAVVSGVFNGTLGGSPVGPIPVTMVLSGSLSGAALYNAATSGFSVWHTTVPLELIKLQVQQPTGYIGSPGVVSGVFSLIPDGTEDVDTIMSKLSKSFNDFFRNGTVPPMPSTAPTGAVGNITIVSIT